MSGGRKAAETLRRRHGSDYFSELAKKNKAKRHFAKLKTEDSNQLRVYAILGNRRSLDSRRKAKK